AAQDLRSECARTGGDPAAGRAGALGRAVSKALSWHRRRLGDASAGAGARQGRAAMTGAALAQSALASLPEIVVIAGACMLLILGEVVRKGRGAFLLWASVAIVLVAALATLMLAGEARPAYAGMFIADRFAVFFEVVFYLTAVLTFLLSQKYAEIEGIESSE